MANLLNEQDIRQQVEKHLQKGLMELTLISQSSNWIYKLETIDKEKYILKIPKLQSGKLSPFWKQLESIFGFNYLDNFENSIAIANIISKNPSISVPHFVLIPNGSNIPSKYFLLSSLVEGNQYEPDEFPSNPITNMRIGEYVGYIHSLKQHGFGMINSKTLRKLGEFYKVVLDSMGQTIDEFWFDNKEVNEYFQFYIKNISSNVIVSESSFIMPDISANQFIYTNDVVTNIVDIDAYVIGPKELELSVLECCITNPNQFKLGYEKYSKIPSFQDFRLFYRFLLYLQDPFNPIDFESFMSRSIHFE